MMDNKKSSAIGVARFFLKEVADDLKTIKHFGTIAPIIELEKTRYDYVLLVLDNSLKLKNKFVGTGLYVIITNQNLL